MSLRWILAVLSVASLAACGSEPAAGDECTTDEDCGDTLVCDLPDEADAGACADVEE